MDFETFLALIGFIFIVICGLVMKYCNENVYVKGKYDRGRYLTYKKQKVGK